MPASIANPFPAAVPDREWVYLVGLPDGRVKVGKTSSPRSRLAHHRRTIGMAWCRLMGCGNPAWAGRAEAKAIEVLATFSRRAGRTEVFNGITRERAVRLVRAACKHARERRPHDPFRYPRLSCKAPEFKDWFERHFRDRRGDWFAGPPLPDHLKLARTPWLNRVEA